MTDQEHTQADHDAGYEVDDSYEAFPNYCQGCGDPLEIDNTYGYCSDECEDRWIQHHSGI